MKTPPKRTKYLFTFLLFLFLPPALSSAAERVRLAYPSKSLNYLPLFLGKDKGIYQTEGIDSRAVTSDLQDYIGLGKSVSRGFGTIKRVRELGVKELES